MRFPSASAVVVALSTFVAVSASALLVSQLTPAEQTGAIVPIPVITTLAAPEGEGDPLGAWVADNPSARESSDAGRPSNGSTTGQSLAVEPAPAQPVDETEPSKTPPGLTGGHPSNNGNGPGPDGGGPPGNNGETGRPSTGD